MKLQWRRTLVLFVLYSALTAGQLHAQDGKIISLTNYAIHDTDAVVLKKRYPFYDSISSVTSLQQICRHHKYTPKLSVGLCDINIQE